MANVLLIINSISLSDNMFQLYSRPIFVIAEEVNR